MLDEGLPRWEDKRQCRINQRRRNEAKQPTKLVRVDAHANVDVVVDSIDETWECISGLFRFGCGEDIKTW